MSLLILVIRNISDAFLGIYESPFKSSDLYDEQIHNLNIPTQADDKRNLYNDRKAVNKDFNKSFNDYKLDRAV
jgi:hypothetical protein